MTTPATTPLKHPLDWQAEKKTPQPIYNLAIAVAWHKRIASPNYVPDDPSFVYDGPIVDPTGDETGAMAEATYDAMIADAQRVLQSCREAAQKLVPSVPAKYVRIVSHPSISYAVVVRMPINAAGKQMLLRMKDANDQLDSMTFELSQHMLWPAEGSVEKGDLINGLPLAFQTALPEAFLGLTGAKGADLKKLA